MIVLWSDIQRESIPMVHPFLLFLYMWKESKPFIHFSRMHLPKTNCRSISWILKAHLLKSGCTKSDDTHWFTSSVMSMLKAMCSIYNKAFCKSKSLQKNNRYNKKIDKLSDDNWVMSNKHNRRLGKRKKKRERKKEKKSCWWPGQLLHPSCYFYTCIGALNSVQILYSWKHDFT